MTCENCIHNGVCYLQEVTNDIEEQLEEFGCENYKSSTNFVEVVHCIDCKHRRFSQCSMFFLEYSEITGDYIVVDDTEDDGFCYCGERIENE